MLEDDPWRFTVSSPPVIRAAVQGSPTFRGSR